MSTTDPSDEEVAHRIVLSYRSPEADADRERWPLADSDWIRRAILQDSYLGYLRTVHGGHVERGDEWEEFVSSGCGSSNDVLLRVEAVEGGSILDAETEFRVVPRREFVGEALEYEPADRPEHDG